MKLWERARAKAGSGRLLSNSLWMLGGQGLSVVAQAGYFIAVARLLGSTEYGVFVGAAATVSMVSQYSSFGSGLLFLRHVSPDHSRFPQYWGNILLSTFTLGSLLVLLLAVSGPLLFHGIGLGILVSVAVSECICNQLTAACSQVFQAFERMRTTAVLSLVVSCARMVVALVMLFTLHRASATEWAVASLAVSTGALLAVLVLVTVRFGRPQFVPRLFVERAREGFVFAVSGSTTSIYNDVDKAMLAHLGMNAANGIYTMAYRVIDIGAMPIRSIHAAAFPRFFREGAAPDGLENTGRFARRLLRRTSVLGVGIAVALFLAAPLIPLLVGRGFAPSVIALRWLCLIPFFRAFHLSAGDALAGAGRQGLRLLFQIVASVLNLGMNLVLIPRFSWLGAAWASLATDALLGAMLWTVLLALGRPKADPATDGLILNAAL